MLILNKGDKKMLYICIPVEIAINIIENNKDIT